MFIKDDDDFVIYNVTEENLESWIQKKHTDPTEYNKGLPDTSLFLIIMFIATTCTFYRLIQIV